MKLLRAAFALLSLAVLATCAPTPSPGPALWKLSDADSEIWLLGTVHVLPRDVAWKSPAIEAAFAQAEVIYFETPTDDTAAQEVAAVVQQEGLNPKGVTLSSQLAGADHARLVRVAAQFGVPMAAMELQRPWLAALQLSLAALSREGYVAEAGVERVLEADAAKAGKRIAYFETPTEQMQIFGRLSAQAERQFLVSTLRQIEEEKAASAQLDKLWSRGDVAGLTKLTLPMIDEAGPEVADALIYARNGRWVAKIDELMAGKGRVFIAVGAAHLVGERGLPAQLRARGYAVEGP
jgi:uncharacterized protein